MTDEWADAMRPPGERILLGCIDAMLVNLEVDSDWDASRLLLAIEDAIACANDAKDRYRLNDRIGWT